MKPKTLIKIGKWSSIVFFLLALLQVLAMLFGIVSHYHETAEKRLAMPQAILFAFVLPIVLKSIIFGSFALTVSSRLFKTSLFLLIFYILTVFWDFLSSEYYHPLAVVFHLVVVTLLLQAILGMYRERLIWNDLCQVPRFNYFCSLLHFFNDTSRCRLLRQ